MTLAEAQHRYRQRQRQIQAWHALQLSGVVILLSIMAATLSGCLVTAIKTPIVDFGIDVRFHKPEWVLLDRFNHEATP